MTPQEVRMLFVALEALEYHVEQTRPIHRTSEAIAALRAALAEPEQTRSRNLRDAGYTRRPRQLPREDEQEPYPLPESLYFDSKDWVASDYAGRVGWLHFMYESKTREVERLETTLLAALAQPEQEPEKEPVAWMVYTLDGKSVCVTDNPADFTDQHKALPLYTAPPQRKPL